MSRSWTRLLQNNMNKTYHHSKVINKRIKCNYCWRPANIDCIKCKQQLCDDHSNYKCIDEVIGGV
jgi:hypothetical protein